MEFAFLAALEEHTNCLTDKNIDKGLAKVKTKYEKRLKPFKDKLKNIELTVTTKTVAKNLIGAGTGFAGMDDMEIADRVAETYHFVGMKTRSRNALAFSEAKRNNNDELIACV